VVDVLDVDGALLDAGTAGRAAPQDIRVDDPALLGRPDERPDGLVVVGAHDPLVAGLGDSVLVLGLGAGRGEVRDVVLGGGRAAEDVRRLGEQVVAQVHDQQLG
jgi:hypothetical protein